MMKLKRGRIVKHVANESAWYDMIYDMIWYDMIDMMKICKEDTPVTKGAFMGVLKLESAMWKRRINSKN